MLEIAIAALGEVLSDEDKEKFLPKPEQAEYTEEKEEQNDDI
jgi:hypothetical protein